MSVATSLKRWVMGAALVGVSVGVLLAVLSRPALAAKKTCWCTQGDDGHNWACDGTSACKPGTWSCAVVCIG